jgi:uncharacterized protein YjiK
MFDPAQVKVRRWELHAQDLPILEGPGVAADSAEINGVYRLRACARVEARLGGWALSVSCATLAFPPRHRCLVCGSEEPAQLVSLPRRGSVYTTTTIHVPVPGLLSPYALAVVELD